MSNTDLATQPLPALVLFGRDEAGKPHAAWFDAASTTLATKAAGMMSMRAVSVESEPLRDLAGGLPRGRTFASGRAFTPFVKAKLFEQLANLTQSLPSLATLPVSDVAAEAPGSEPASTGTAAAAGENSAGPEAAAAPKRRPIRRKSASAAPSSPPPVRPKAGSKPTSSASTATC